MNFITITFRFPSSLLALIVVAASAVAAPDDLVVEPDAKANQAGGMFGMNMDARQIEAMVYQPHDSAAEVRKYIDATLGLRIDEIHRECQLTDAQRMKLELAAANDMQRYFDDADAVLKKYKKGVGGQEEWNKFWGDVQPVQQKLSQGLFGRSSFFEKSILRVLNPTQREQYEKLSLDRRTFHYRSSIEATFFMIEGTLPLRKSQQEELTKLLLEQAAPPDLEGHNARFLVLNRMSRLPTDKVKPLLSEYQWKLFTRVSTQFDGQIRFFVQQGMIDEEELTEEQRAANRAEQGNGQNPAEDQDQEVVP